MNYVYVGKIVGTHGLKGELKLKSSFLYEDRILKQGFCFYIGSLKKKVSLFSYRYHNGVYLLSFEGLLDINLVESFKGEDVFVIRSDLGLSEEEYVFEDYIGLDSYDGDVFLGKVNDIVDCGNGNYVFDIIGSKEILIPLNKQFIDKVVLGDKIVFKDVEGIVDAN